MYQHKFSSIYIKQHFYVDELWLLNTCINIINADQQTLSAETVWLFVFFLHLWTHVS